MPQDPTDNHLRDTDRKKKLYLGVGVGIVMIVIVGLWAINMNSLIRDVAKNPRDAGIINIVEDDLDDIWSALKESEEKSKAVLNTSTIPTTTEAVELSEKDQSFLDKLLAAVAATSSTTSTASSTASSTQ